jgi:glucose-specific phosphotransferase system IIA component
MKVGTKMNIHFRKPIKGEYLDITKASDDIFSQKLLGPGFLVKPKDNHIYSPICGKIKMIYPTLHAIAISTENLDILIHVGLTEKIRHKDLFILHVKLGDTVLAGDKLLSFNFDFNDYHEDDYQIPIVFVQKHALQILNECEDSIELGIL